ncbi:hypothetical protein ANN_17849 [Periplaneta americana]|uniref:Reverse transcriptase n=1 Tax=Periplaneta americana TaxID=6978 RepID=A0ABQ8SV32_PERAM|nr:hypothetical protein ANN_17849 [Periplaneta americana]
MDNFSFLGPQFDFVVHTGENNRGTAIIYRAGFIVKNIEGHPSGRVTSLTLNDTHIVNVYLPSGTNNRNERENFLSKDLPFFLRHRYNQLILGGDWNCVLQAKDQSGSYNPSPVLKTLVTDLKLVDTWENKHGNNVTFTFHRQNSVSRLDRFYISEAYTNDIYNVTVIPTPFSDHDCVRLSTITETIPSLYGRSYWKLNNSLIQRHDVKQNFNDHFENIKRRVQNSPLSIMQKWIRIIKPGIKSFYQTAGYLRAQESRATLQFYYQMLNELYSRHKTEGNKWEEIRQVKRTICTLQEKTMYEVVIRSKVPTINEDEKCALYHLVKEKQKQHVKFIRNLQTAAGKTLNTNNECITEFEKHFTSLYENTNTSQQQTQKILKHVNRHLSVIQQEELQHPITEEEIRKALDSTPKHTAPGPDGLTYQFYKTHWIVMKEYLLELFNYIFNTHDIIDGFSDGVVTLIPKKKSANTAADYRPITLLNTDYKLLMKVLANRFRPISEHIFETGQTCGIPNKSS